MRQIPCYVTFLFFALCNVPTNPTNAQDSSTTVPKYDGQSAVMAKPVQVFLLLGQSNMVGLGKVSGGEISLEHAVKEKKKYPYLIDESNNWIQRKDVRFVRYMSGKGPLNNDWLQVQGKTLGPELGIGHPLGNAIDAPVLLLKCCIGNRALGWDLLPPGSKRREFNAPNAKFVCATLGESVKGSAGPSGDVLNAHLAVDGATGKYPEFKGNVATIYTHPMAQGGSGNGHYGGKAEVYMDVGEAMGNAMVNLLQLPPNN